MLVSERIARFEEGRLPMSQLVEDLSALEAALDPPRDSWRSTYDLALRGLRSRVTSWQAREASGFAAVPEPDHQQVDVRDLVQTIARLVRHPDDA